MSIIALLEKIFGIIGKFLDVFPEWWKNYQVKKRAEWIEEIRRMKVKRLEIKRKMKDATLDERETLNKEYFALNDRILYLERLLAKKD